MPNTPRTSNHVTILDVARASGFSASTVSIVLNDAPLSQHVSVRTKEHIRKTAQTMGYRPDAFARSLRSRRSSTIGVMIFDISDPICTLILRGIERGLDPTGYLPIIMDAHNERKQFERYLEMLLERRVEGLIVVANWLFSEIEPLPEFGRNKIPTVVVGRDLSTSPISSVIVDDRAGGYAAMEHLYALGHRRIAFILGPRQLQDSTRRWQGIRELAREKRLAIDPALVTQLTASNDPFSGFEGGCQLTARLLESGADFTAMLAFDDLTALGAMRALHQAGRSVPRHCSVIGFDGVPPAALVSPALTTIRQPLEDMGETAVRWMLAYLQPGEGNGAAMPVRTMLPPELIARDSTGPIASD